MINDQMQLHIFPASSIPFLPSLWTELQINVIAIIPQTIIFKYVTIKNDSVVMTDEGVWCVGVGSKSDVDSCDWTKGDFESQ